MIADKYRLPSPGEIFLTQTERKYIDFVTEKQLLNEKMWEHFINVFGTNADDCDLGWRGEYWGKMMRGGCLVYRCIENPALYEVLLESVKKLLSRADKNGRISTYSAEHEFNGWDIWCRKYVLTGMLHFCDICKDNALTETILDKMEKHVDCIIERVGGGENKLDITKTSDFWLGVNSCSILETVIDLYTRRPEKRFLDFASYIITTGGCSGENLIELALSDEKAPYQYPETKAYETMSFFEGVLAYYKITGEEKYFKAVENFVKRVYETDITIIGCAGCTHELFDNSAVKQTEYSEIIMQETCVTVTWMRLCAKLFLLTGEDKYASHIEQSALNALYGSVNLYNQAQTLPDSGKILPPLPFDSYSPLFFNRRGIGVGGLKFFDNEEFYGCCAAIGAAGIAVYPLIKSLREKKATTSELIEHKLNNCIAFSFGPYVLAYDSLKQEYDFSKPLIPKIENGKLLFQLLTPINDESLRLKLETENGDLLLTDYASCGKLWSKPDSLISVWFPSTD